MKSRQWEKRDDGSGLSWVWDPGDDVPHLLFIHPKGRAKYVAEYWEADDTQVATWIFKTLSAAKAFLEAYSAVAGRKHD